MKKFKLPKEIKKAATLLEKIVSERMKGENRKDAEFRALILGTEIGDLHKYITHDKELNKSARPHGSKEDEILAYGQALIQLFALAFLRKIPINKALELAIKNWLDRDWKIKKSVVSYKGLIKGITAYPGKVEGEVFLADDISVLSFPGNLILVVSCLKPDHFPILTTNKPLAIVTDHGGMTSHGAIIARELGITCVVGTGEATRKINHGARIRVEARKTGEAKIILAI
ncbi:MAG TPA: PEP-utilizing enzyme [Candidatus Nanoarchaeia archaeon]